MVDTEYLADDYKIIMAVGKWQFSGLG